MSTTASHRRRNALEVSRSRKLHAREKVARDTFERIRVESREARKKLIDVILCDHKDVLSDREIKEIKHCLNIFLRIQKRLGIAWFQGCEAFGQVIWEAGGIQDPMVQPN